MKNNNKPVALLNKELTGMRQRIAEPEALETQHKQATEVSQGPEQPYRMLIEVANNIEEGIAIVQDVKDRQGAIIFTNDAVTKLLGYSRKELLQMSLSDLLSPATIKELTHRYQRRQAGEETEENYETLILAKDGTEVPMQVKVSSTIYEGKPAIVGFIRNITERKQAEEALRRSKEHFQALIENSFDTIMILNVDGSIGYASTSIDRLLGYEAEELIGKSVFDFIHPDSLEKGITILYDLIKIPGSISKLELKVQHKDGSWRTAEAIGSNLLDNPSVAGIVVNLRDTTDRKKAEEALRRSKERFQALIENTFDTIIVLNRDGSVSYVSPPLKRMLGYEPEEWVGKSVFSFIHPDSLENIKSVFYEGIKTTGNVGFLEMPMQHKDGSWRIIEGTGDNFLSNPSIAGIVASFRDITENRQTENRYKGLIEDINDGYIVYQDDGVVIANQRFLEIFGYTMDEVLGQSFLDFIAFDALQEAEEIYMYAESGTDDTRRYEIPAKRGDGIQIVVELSHKPIEYKGKRAYSVIFRDVTERKKTEEALRRSNEELQQFAYVASHDLQEPLRMVSSYVQLLARRYQGKLDDDADEFIEYAVDGATRMKKLINDLLAYSRISTQGNKFEPTDCETVFERAIYSLQTAIEESGVVVTHDALPSITGDATQLAQLFQNLIGNAIKFRGEESHRVHVSAQWRGDEWLFSVSDNGIGIDPQFHDRIFTIFQRLNSRVEYDGTGIGLTICRRIVERHGGRIWVESEYGNGATFYFTIPVTGGDN